MIRFRTETALDAAPAAAFDASLDIGAHLASMAASEETAVAGVTSGNIGLGETVTWRARHFGLWWTMTSTITQLDRPVSFTDEQVRGPFAQFRHVHRFEPRPDGGTTMTDDVTFIAPFGALGRVAERAVLGRYVRRLIESRNEWLRRYLDQ
ncbi:SRPBCC family protein [Ruania alba]|uniref:Polyketide cyclase / dehydrase and lipid transport n=1 Tax=Ruania alba TaxID=648782 RepID=A0A1H5DV77_9MICO|nr:SRPBCC family protein [Ruania alba]SED82792.1 Polyketide cyclase / dehydrase and lipid transport [Ruania alba]